jgi:quercetin dioxygenase-like cupin family protein
VHDPDRGFFRMTARMLVNGPSAGQRSFTVGMSTFAPGAGCHDLHRHAHAEELFFVWSGEGAHLSAHADPHGLRAGDLTWVARNEDHGFRNTGAIPVRAMFCYLGTDDRAGAGYELSRTDSDS